MIFGIRLIILPILLCLLVSSCSSSEEQEKKGVIEQTAEEIAAEAVDRIKAPIAKANLAKELQENHNKEIEESKDSQ